MRLFCCFSAACRRLSLVACIVAILTGRGAADEHRPQPLPTQTLVEQPSPTRRIVVRLSGDLLADLVDREIDEPSHVDDVILGTRVVGEARTTGRLQVSTVDDPRQAAFTVTLSGTAVSHTVGRNGPVAIRGRCVTPFTATTRVVFQEGRGFHAEPAVVAADPRSATHGISANRGGLIGRIIVRKAKEQMAASRAEATAIIRHKAERRISAAFDRLLEKGLARLNRTAEVRHLLLALVGGGEAPHYQCCTTAGCLQLAASFGPDETSIELPPIGPKAAPVQVWIHDSIVGESIAHGLRLLDRARTNLDAANLDAISRTFDAVPISLVRELGQPDRPRQLDFPLDYVAAADWIVIQVGSPRD